MIRIRIRLAIVTFAAFIERNLTPVSIGVALFGLGLVLLGPVRDALGGGADRSGSGITSGTSATAGGNAPLVASGGDAAIWGMTALQREIEPYTIIPDRPRNAVMTYFVQPGDTVFGIADRFGLSPDTIFWASEVLRDNVHMLSTGLELYILPTDGVYHRSDGLYTISWIAEHYQVSPEAIIESEYNQLEGYTPDDIPPEGMRIVVPGGVRDYRPDYTWYAPEPASSSSGSTSGTGSQFAPGHPGSCAPTTGYGGAGVWVNPVQGSYRVTTGYYGYHPGIDLAGAEGTPIAAADSGVVIFAGWNNWGYGNLVVLDHGNGWVTLYGHLSSVGVGCGQSVSRGQYIGAMGNTGNSSGPHLHFEMHWNRVPDNPLNSIGF
jgi:murein DD-endopeptidase MepM/ murein hydrolase activator NlpD